MSLESLEGVEAGFSTVSVLSAAFSFLGSASDETDFFSVSFLAEAGSFFSSFSLEGSDLDSGFAFFGLGSSSTDSRLEAFFKTAAFLAASRAA